MKRLFNPITSIIFLLALAVSAFADVKVRQKVTMNGQTFETTRMIKGARERTEQKSDAKGGAADFMSQVASVTQCDLRRTLRINDNKKLYFIEPFGETDAQNPAPAGKPNTQKTRRGGTVTITYVVTDTGERKTLFGLAARHLKITQEIESSADSCNGASKTKMETDGWYVDFSAEFNCPIDVPEMPGRAENPDCQDRIVTKRSGSEKTGFLLNGTTAFYDASGSEMMRQTTETLELSRSPLAAELFDIPQNYNQVSSSQELYSMPNMEDLMKQQNDTDETKNEQQNMPTNKGAKNVGLNINLGGNTKINQTEITDYLRDKLRKNNFNSRIGAGSGLDFVLTVEIKKVKESAAGKVGGIFGKVTGVETKAGKTEVELVMTMTKADSTAAVKQSRVAQKFDGAATEAVKAAIDKALDEILSGINN